MEIATTTGEPDRQDILNNAAARDATLPMIRERARQKYLQKRVPEQLVLLRKQVEEEAEEEKMIPHSQRKNWQTLRGTELS